MLKIKPHWDKNTPFDNSWKQYDSLSTGEFFDLSVERAFESGTTAGLIEQDTRIMDAEKAAGTYNENWWIGGLTGTEPTNPHAMSEEDWKQSPYYRKEISYTPTMTPQRAQILSQDFDERSKQDALITKGGATLGRKVLGFGAAMIGSLPDPINFVPIGGALGAGASVGKRALSAAKAGAVSTALVDAIIMPENIRRGENLGFEDFALDVMFGGVLGGVLGGGAAFVGDAIKARRTPTRSSDTPSLPEPAPFDSSFDNFLDSAEASSTDLATPPIISVDITPDQIQAQRFFDGDTSINQDALRGLFMSEGMSLAESRALTAQIFQGFEVGELNDASLHSMADLLRQSIGGNKRANIGMFMEDLLTQLNADNSKPINYTQLMEKHNMAQVYDHVFDEVVHRAVGGLEPDESMLFIRADGEPIAIGRDVYTSGENIVQTYSIRNTDGMFRISSKADDLPEGARTISREEMASIPQSVRDFVPTNTESGKKWVVPQTDGSKMVIEQGQGRNVTAYVSSDENLPISARTPEGGILPDTQSTAQGDTGNLTDTSNIGLQADEATIRELDEMLDYGVESEMQRLMDEGKIDDSAINTLQEIDAEVTRLEKLERAAMGVVNCVWKGK